MADLQTDPERRSSMCHMPWEPACVSLACLTWSLTQADGIRPQQGPSTPCPLVGRLGQI